jgi:hypothetical protein
LWVQVKSLCFSAKAAKAPLTHPDSLVNILHLCISPWRYTVIKKNHFVSKCQISCP